MTPATEAPSCVHCRRRAIDPRWRPFCSERCRLLDLGRWFDGDFRVAGEPTGPVEPPEPGGPDPHGPGHRD